MTYTRHCPACSKEITYKSKDHRDRAEKKGSRCKVCSQKGRKLSAEHRAKLSAVSKGNKSRTGMTQTPETRAKIAEALKGSKYSPERCAKISESNKRTKSTPEYKVKARAAQRKRWGTECTPTPRRSGWAKEVKERDNHECQYCGAEEDLHAHHIFSAAKWPELAQNVNNGITLCAPCHRWHHKYNYLV